MDIHINNIDKLPAETQKIFTPWLKALIKKHKDNLLSVFIYGPAADKDFRPGTSPITSVFVLEALPFSSLHESLKIINAGIPKKIAAPLFLTREHIETSLDVFPLEFHEMQEKQILLYGEDILGPLKIADQHTRLFCEQQIKGKLIRIRQAYLEIGLKNKGIEALLKESLSSLLPVFRGLLRLKGETPPSSHQEALNQVCLHFDLDENIFIPILKDKTDDEKIADKEVAFFLEKYLVEIEKLAQEVDKL